MTILQITIKSYVKDYDHNVSKYLSPCFKSSYSYNTVKIILGFAKHSNLYSALTIYSNKN